MSASPLTEEPGDSITSMLIDFPVRLNSARALQNAANCDPIQLPYGPIIAQYLAALASFGDPPSADHMAASPNNRVPCNTPIV